ncbi:MAG: hypothetical protein V1798_03935 [Pseudomonadota bacterium]
MIQSPMQTVTAKFGSKEKLVDQLSGSLERGEGESKDSLKKRLLASSNSKLLALAARHAKPKKPK